MPNSRVVLGAALLALAAPGRLLAVQEEKGGSLKQALLLYRQNQLAAALPFFEAAVTADSANPTTLAWLAETLRRLEQGERAVTVARRALKLSPCHAFAHAVIGTAYNPQFGIGLDNYDSVWVHLKRAVECDPDDGNAWLNIWGESLRRGDQRIEQQALGRLIDSKFLSRTALSYNRWILRDLPPNALLLSNGDLDTYPALALQLKEGVRRDVVVANAGMLNLWWYVLLLHARFGLPLPPDSAALATRPMCGTGGADTVCLGQLVQLEWRRQAADGRLRRPLAVMWADMVPPGPGVLVQTGAVVMVHGTARSTLDTAATWRSLRGVDGRDFADPGVTAADRSAVRLASDAQRGMPLHVAWIAVLYGEALVDAERLFEAQQVLEWVRRFARDAALDTPQTQTLIDNYVRALESAGREP
jgi:hypothetical protein